MLHSEYHTCDKCGKVIHIRKGVFANQDRFSIEIPSAHVNEYLCSFISGVTKYELCKHCAKELKKVVEQYMKKDDSNTNEW